MVGSNKSTQQLAAIADRTIQEADEDKDGFIDFEEFRKVCVFFCCILLNWGNVDVNSRIYFPNK